MKTIPQIAKTCDTSRDNVYRAVLRLNVIAVKKKGRINYYDEYQEFLIIEHLWHIGKANTLIFESKMNKPVEQEPFSEFKKRIYGKK